MSWIFLLLTSNIIFCIYTFNCHLHVDMHASAHACVLARRYPCVLPPLVNFCLYMRKYVHSYVHVCMRSIVASRHPRDCLSACLFIYMPFCLQACIYEPRHDISNNVVCATSKGSNQPAQTHTLIRAFASW